MEPEFVRGELFSAFVKLTQDEQDSVRLLTVKALVSFAPLYQAKEHAGER